ncbi:hypothetical protein [Mycobacterium sp. IDR2000157661]|uniref:hypothetical protein n=1 Tax=Mycobacterium sp. IDR2000157661 TaxID=2867005 RepID=UPI001EEBD3D1|nr:hypothetical protein [Mycobacterium sp. IDR2000157661]ULE31163.1 hypothetical protein K3G64_00300 [Mycobacterium sp. IDR2000157661]
MPATLSEEQRHLIAFVARTNGTMLLKAMIDDHAMQALLARAGGATAPTAPDGAPDWMTSYWTVADKFVSPGRDKMRVKVTAAQVRKLGRSLPAGLHAEIRQCLDAHSAERERTREWCYCPYAHTAPNAHSGPCARHHPSADEDAEHRHRAAELRTWSETLLRQALYPAAGVQLDLFATLR